MGVRWMTVACRCVLLVMSCTLFFAHETRGWGKEADPKIAAFMKERDVPRKALVIGVRRYRHLNEVPSAEIDARSFAERLQSEGFVVTLSIDESSQEIWDRLREFGRQLQPNEVALVYFSGHGFQIDGLNYLAAADTPQVFSEGADDLSYLAIALDAIIDRLKSRRPAFSILIVDACRENQVTLKRPDGTAKSLGHAGLAPLTPPPQLVMGFATYFGKIAFSSNSPSKNSIYTQYLNKHFSRGDVELLQLLRDVSLDVTAERSDQTPEMRIVTAGNFYPKPGGKAKAEERATWENALKQWNPAETHSFLMHWPAGAFAASAREWLDRIPPPVEAPRMTQAVSSYVSAPYKSAGSEAVAIKTTTRLETTNLIAEALPQAVKSDGSISGGLSITTRDLPVFVSAQGAAASAAVLPQNSLVKVLQACPDAAGAKCRSEVEIQPGTRAARRAFIEGAFEKSVTQTKVTGPMQGDALKADLKLLPMLDSDIENDTVRVRSVQFVLAKEQDRKSDVGFGYGLTLDQLPTLLGQVIDRDEKETRGLLAKAIAEVTIDVRRAAPTADTQPQPDSDSRLYLRTLQIRNQLEDAGVRKENVIIGVASTGDRGSVESLDRIVLTLPR
jgi:hypothetical protein